MLELGEDRRILNQVFEQLNFFQKRVENFSLHQYCLGWLWEKQVGISTSSEGIGGDFRCSAACLESEGEFNKILIPRFMD